MAQDHGPPRYADDAAGRGLGDAKGLGYRFVLLTVYVPFGVLSTSVLVFFIYSTWVGVFVVIACIAMMSAGHVLAAKLAARLGLPYDGFT